MARTAPLYVIVRRTSAPLVVIFNCQHNNGGVNEMVVGTCVLPCCRAFLFPYVPSAPVSLRKAGKVVCCDVTELPQMSCCTVK